MGVFGSIYMNQLTDELLCRFKFCSYGFTISRTLSCIRPSDVVIDIFQMKVYRTEFVIPAVSSDRVPSHRSSKCCQAKSLSRYSNFPTGFINGGRIAKGRQNFHIVMQAQQK